MPRKSRRRNRRVSSTKRIRGTRRVSRVRRFRISRGGDLWQETKEKALKLASEVQAKASDLTKQAASAFDAKKESTETEARN